MNYKEYSYIKSDENEVLNILEGIPEEDWISRMSFEGRLASIRAKLEGVEPPEPPKKAVLTFRGEPVRGSEAMNADFAGKITNYFNDVVVSIAASLENRLGYMGRISGKQENQLMITGTALGSFGFEYEIPNTYGEEKGTSELALENLIKIFEASAEDDDEALSEIVDEIHPRAARKIADFLAYIAKEEAYCGLGVGDSRYQFKNVEAIGKAAAKVKSDNIKRGQERFSGKLLGALPNSREFEFKQDSGNQVIKGRIGMDISKPDEVLSYTGKDAAIELSYIQIGQARPRYTLETLDDLEEINEGEINNSIISLRHAFWEKLEVELKREKINEDVSEYTRNGCYVWWAIDRPKIRYALTLKKDWFGVELYFKDEQDLAYASLKQQRKIIDVETSLSLKWESQKVIVTREVDLKERGNWDEYINWFLKNVPEFTGLFNEKLKNDI